MPTIPQTRTRKLTIVAQDPSILHKGEIVTTQVDVPAEELAIGPRGYRVHVIDYDASTRTLYKPFKYPPPVKGGYIDPFKNPQKDTILNDPGFHAQNVYAIVMRTLARFEFALGRRLSWNFEGHQLKIAPHAFSDANAFYSKRDEALMFGYFSSRSGRKPVFTCLSHDVIAHETTHALLDGLHCCYTDPSTSDQAAFHEGLADIVALLSVFSLKDVVKIALDQGIHKHSPQTSHQSLVHTDNIDPKILRMSLLFGLAEQMGEEVTAVRGRALRRSAMDLNPSPNHINDPDYQEPHNRGEILVAAMMNAFIEVWTERLKALGHVHGKHLDRERVVEEASEAADYMMTMTIRAMDYLPPIHLEFGDFLSALLTADHEIRPDDSKYEFRKNILESFMSYGIYPTTLGVRLIEEGLWASPREKLSYDRIHFDALARDPDEMFRFVWENRKPLKLFEGAFTIIKSLRPCLRIAPDDGFPLKEIVTECVQKMELQAKELKKFDVQKPEGMPDDTRIVLRGGVTLVFNEFGRLKFDIGKNILKKEIQQRCLDYLWKHGYFEPGASLRRRFSNLHRQRGIRPYRDIKEEW